MVRLPRVNKLRHTNSQVGGAALDNESGTIRAQTSCADSNLSEVPAVALQFRI